LKKIVKAESLQKVIIRISADITPPPMPTSVAIEWFKKNVESEFPNEVKFASIKLVHFINTLMP
tara:strand:- start:534 stop:725 length:192 start_codon:yes stop_codon:yes gene_type:complete